MKSHGPESSYVYVAYGLGFTSNVPIEGLKSCATSGDTRCVRITFESVPAIDHSDIPQVLRYESSYAREFGKPALRIWEVNGGKFLRILYSDGVEFWLNRNLNNIWAAWPDSSTLQDTLAYLLGPVLGLFLRLRGTVCLHASAITIDERSVVFVGAEGAGKSTTAAGFAQQGHAVLSDDIVALAEHDQRFHVLPAYPAVNLWPDSVRMLYGSPDALPRISADWDKRFLALDEKNTSRFERRQLPIGAIYVFDDSEAASGQCFTSVSKKDALLMLVANTYATNFLDARQRAEEFAVLSRLVDQVPVRKVNPRRGIVSVEAFCELIRQDFAGVRSGESRS